MLQERAMDRIEALRQLLERVQVDNPARWIEMERAEGERGAVLEMLTLFSAVEGSMLDRNNPKWLDLLAQNVFRHKSRQSPIREAFLAVAASNVDREALIEVIRWFQSHVAWMFFNVHDRTCPADEAAEHLKFNLVHEDRSTYSTGDYDRRVERMNLLPDELHEHFENFLEDIGDDYA
jgi:hypothetical protein